MAKQPPVENFKITCEVEVQNLGPAMVKLTQIEGLIVTGSELVTTVRRFARNEKPEVKTVDLLREWIKEHPTFKAKEAANAVIASNGGTGASAYHVLKVLVKEGLLKKLGGGMYSRTDVKALAAPSKKKKPAGRKALRKRGTDVILSYAKSNHGRFNTPKLVKVFEKEGRSRNSVYASIDELLKKKLAKRVGEAGSGQYVLLSKAAAPKKTERLAANGKEQPPLAPALNLNGAGV